MRFPKANALYGSSNVYILTFACMSFPKANALHGSFNVYFRKLGYVPFPDASVHVISQRENIFLRAFSRSSAALHDLGVCASICI